MATSKAVETRRSWGAEALISLIPEGYRSDVVRVKLDDDGGWYEIPGVREALSVVGGVPLEVMPGQHPLRPVIREADTGRIVEGSGRYPNANNPAVVGAMAAIKRSKSYREAVEALVPYEDENARFTLERLIEDAFDAAEGSPQTATCAHCGRAQLHVLKKDGNLIFKLIELLVGTAPKTIEVRGDISLRLQEVMQARETLPVIAMSKEQFEERHARMLADGIINPEWEQEEVVEGEFKELEHDNSPEPTDG